MSQTQKNKCLHSQIFPFESSQNKYTFCPNCGIVIISDQNNNQVRFLTKPQNQEKKLAISPIEISLIMKEKTNNVYGKEKIKVTNWYIKNRKKILVYLQKLTLQMKYSDATFYTTLLFLDKYLKKEDGQNEKLKKNLDYFVLAFFLLFAKLYENNIFEPNLTQFEFSDGKKTLNLREIKEYEIECLNMIQYDVIDFSAYDWLSVLLNNGFVFEDEIDNLAKNTIQSIYTFTKKTLAAITNKELFLHFSPFHLALSIIKIAREKYSLEGDNNNFDIICDIYQTKFSDFKNCYTSIKEVIDQKNRRNEIKYKTLREPNYTSFAEPTNALKIHSPNLDTFKIKEHYRIDCDSTANNTNRNSTDFNLQSTTCYLNPTKKSSSSSTSTSVNGKKAKKANKSNNALKNVLLEEDNPKRKKSKILKTKTIENSKKNKNSFVNNIDKYLSCLTTSYNTTCNEKGQSNLDYAIRTKYSGSFVSSGGSKAPKKFSDPSIGKKRSFILNTDSNHNGISNMKYKLSSSLIANSQRNKPIISIQSKLPMITKLSGHM